MKLFSVLTKKKNNRSEDEKHKEHEDEKNEKDGEENGNTPQNSSNQPSSSENLTDDNGESGKKKKSNKKERNKKDKKKSKNKKKNKDSYVTIDGEEEVEPEKYYDDMAKVFGFARYASMAILVVFILVMFSFFGSEFTGENFRYLLKHIDMNSSGIIDEFKTVVYDSAEGTVFCEYQQDFVIAAPGSLKIYDYKGVMTLSSLPLTETPRLCSSERYVLLYDRGDEDYYVYNSFSLLRQRECDNKIIMADMSDSGTFAIVTESLEYAAHIYVYNQSFELINEIKKKNPVSDVKVSDDGNKLAVTTFELSDDAEFESVITVYSLADSSIEFERTLNGEFPVSVEFDNGDGVNVLTTEKFRFYDRDRNEKNFNVKKSSSSLVITSSDLWAYSTGSDGIGSENTVYIIDSSLGKVTADIEIGSKIKQMGTGGRYVFLLTDDNIYRVDKEGNVKTISLSDPVCMVTSPSGNVFICYESRADLIKF